MSLFTSKWVYRAVELRHCFAINRQRRQSKFHYLVWKNKLSWLSIFVILGITSSIYALEIQNPIAPTSNFPQLIERIAEAVRIIAMPLAIAAIIFVGFKLVVAASRGDEKGLGEAKKMLWWVLIGTAIIIGASVLAQAVVNFARTLNN